MNNESADFGFETEGWKEVNSRLIDARDSMEDIVDAMRNVVRNTLLQVGMQGDTANILTEKYDEEVLSSARRFIDRLTEFITTNQTAQTNAQDVSDETQRIAQGNTQPNG